MTTKKATVKCGDALTISNVADLHGKLTLALEKSSTIELDMHKVEKVDTAGLQLLISLQNELEKSNGNLLCKSPSEAFVEAVTVTGMTSHLTLN